METTIQIHTGEKAKDLLEKEGGKAKLELLGNLANGIRNNHRNRVEAVLTEPEPQENGNDDEEMTQYLLKEVTEAAKRGDMIVATQNGTPVGMIGIARAGHDPITDREVWKVGRISVLEGAGGLHVSRRLVMQALGALREQHPEVDVLMTTEHDGISKVFQRVGVPKIESTTRWYQIIHGREDVSAYQREMDGDAHVDAFLIPREMLGALLEKNQRPGKEEAL